MLKPLWEWSDIAGSATCRLTDYGHIRGERDPREVEGAIYA
ncbi:MAG: hypothetical protein Kow0063_33900 [Anaerolineae bacterium]